MVGETTSLRYDPDTVPIRKKPPEPHLEDYARMLLAAGHSRELIDDVIIGLLWSSLFLGDEE